LSFSVFLI